MSSTDLKYPRGERVWVGYYNAKQKLMFIITSKSDSRDWYFLYECIGKEFKRLGKSKNPLELVDKYRVDERIHAK